MPKPTCSVANCVTRSRVKGMCDKHYQRQRIFGTTDKPLRKTFNKTCEVCSVSFISKSGSAKYCSSRCRVLNRPGLPPLFCVGCDNQIPNSKTSAPQGQARCSECRNAGLGYYEANGRRLSHGRSAYAGGCRCNVCTDAQAQGMREYVQKRVDKFGVGPSVEYRRRERGHDPFRPVFDRQEVPCRACGDMMMSAKPAGEAVHKLCRDESGWYISAADRLAVYERDGWSCQICFHPVDRDSHYLSDWYPTLDHVVPQSVRVDHSFENLRLVCRYCNLARLDRPVEDDHLVRAWALARRSLEVV